LPLPFAFTTRELEKLFDRDYEVYVATNKVYSNPQLI
jgi:hypothetical protein